MLYNLSRFANEMRSIETTPFKQNFLQLLTFYLPFNAVVKISTFTHIFLYFLNVLPFSQRTFSTLSDFATMSPDMALEMHKMHRTQVA